jgi:hypothetical protein
MEGGIGTKDPDMIEASPMPRVPWTQKIQDSDQLAAGPALEHL